MMPVSAKRNIPSLIPVTMIKCIEVSLVKIVDNIALASLSAFCWRACIFMINAYCFLEGGGANKTIMKSNDHCYQQPINLSVVTIYHEQEEKIYFSPVYKL